MNRKRDKLEIKTVIDLEEANKWISSQLNLGNAEKPLLNHIFQGFIALSRLLDLKEPGIFTAVINWFLLYLKMQISIDPKNNKLLQQFEKSIPTAISHIIGCLQYKNRDATDYHYNLLDIMDKLLENCQPNVIKQFTNFQNGTISCIWKPIDFVGDFNTQSLALKIFARLLKTLDIDKQKGELKAIKWTNLKLFKDNLNQVMDKTQQIYALESACRELLNNYNMNLSNKLLVYSFYCNSVVIATKYEFFKPLFLEKFWVDLNYCPHTISFKGRHKLNAQPLQFEDFNVILKWKIIKLEQDCLLITIDKSKPPILPNNILLNLKNHDQLRIHLPHSEEQRIKENDHLMKYLGAIDGIDCYNANPDYLKSNDTPKTVDAGTIGRLAETPLTSINKENSNLKQQYSLRKQSNKRKFFKYFESDEDENQPKKLPKKETKTKATVVKSARILKPRNTTKPVCNVVPLVDLTKSPVSSTKNKTSILDNHDIGITNCQLNEKQCAAILNQVNYVCNKEEIYDFPNESDAEPCQSYRNYKTRPSIYKPNLLKNGRTESLIKSPSKYDPTVKDRQKYRKTDASKGNNIANMPRKIGKSKISKRKIVSQALFDDWKCDEDSSPSQKRTMLAKDIHKNKPNIDVDLVLNDNQVKYSPDISFISSDGGCQTDCDDMQINKHTNKLSTPHSIPKTPTSTTTMNISDINDTPIATTTNHFLLIDPRTEGEIVFRSPFGSQKFNTNEVMEEVTNSHTKAAKDRCIQNMNYEKPSLENTIFRKSNSNEVVEEIIKDCQILDDDQHDAETELTINLNCDKHNRRDCVIYRKRLDSYISDSDSDKDNGVTDQFPVSNNTLHIQQDPLTLSLSTRTIPKCKYERKALASESKLISENLTNTHKTGDQYHITPSILIMRHTEINTRETVLITDSRGRNINMKFNTTNLYNTDEQNNPTQRRDEDLPTSLINKKMEIDLPPHINKNINIRTHLLELYNNESQKNVIQLISNHQNIQHESVPCARHEIESYKNKSLMQQTTLTNDDHHEKLNVENSWKTSAKLLHTYGRNISKSTAFERSLVVNPTRQIEQRKDENSNNKTLITKNSNLLKDCTDAPKIDVLIGLLSSSNNTSNDKSDKCGTKVKLFQKRHDAQVLPEIIVDKTSKKGSSIHANCGNLSNKDLLNYIENSDDAQPTTDSDNCQMCDHEDPFKNDLSEQIEEYNEKVQKTMDNLLTLHITNSFDEIKQKVCDITGSILKQSKEQRKELEHIQSIMERIMQEMVWQYQIYVKKSKEYESFHENTQRMLDALGSLNLQGRISNEYSNLIKQFFTLEEDIRQEVWQNYILNQKQEILNKIDNLSKI